MIALSGLALSALQLFDAPDRVARWLDPAPAPNYSDSLLLAIEDTHNSNLCLASKMTKLDPDENDEQNYRNTGFPECKLHLNNLRIFVSNYANYLGSVPYSGSNSLKSFSDTLLEAENLINNSRSRNDLAAAQSKLGMSISEVGFWLCGLDHYFRLAPGGPGFVKEQSVPEVQLIEIWDQWDAEFGQAQAASRDRRRNYQALDTTNKCSGFIDLID